MEKVLKNNNETSKGYKEKPNLLAIELILSN